MQTPPLTLSFPASSTFTTPTPTPIIDAGYHAHDDSKTSTFHGCYTQHRIAFPSIVVEDEHLHHQWRRRPQSPFRSAAWMTTPPSIDHYVGTWRSSRQDVLFGFPRKSCARALYVRYRINSLQWYSNCSNSHCTITGWPAYFPSDTLYGLPNIHTVAYPALESSTTGW